MSNWWGRLRTFIECQEMKQTADERKFQAPLLQNHLTVYIRCLSISGLTRHLRALTFYLLLFRLYSGPVLYLYSLAICLYSCCLDFVPVLSCVDLSIRIDFTFTSFLYIASCFYHCDIVLLSFLLFLFPFLMHSLYSFDFSFVVLFSCVLFLSLHSVSFLPLHCPQGRIYHWGT